LARPDIDPLEAAMFCEKIRSQFTRMAAEYEKIATDRKRYNRKRVGRALGMWFKEGMVRDFFERGMPKTAAEKAVEAARPAILSCGR
jgi:hypothetical protein